MSFSTPLDCTVWCDVCGDIILSKKMSISKLINIDKHIDVIE